MRKLLLAAPLLVGFMLPAHASLISVTVTGVVYESTDTYGNGFNLGVGGATAVGQQLTVAYLFDSTAVPANSSSNPNFATYGEVGCGQQPVPDSWISAAQVTINGFAIGRSVDPGNLDNCDSLWVQDPLESYFPDYYALSSVAASSSFELSATGWQSSYAFDYTFFGVFGYVSSFLNGLSATQFFSHSLPSSDWGEGYLNRFGNFTTCDFSGTCTSEAWDFTLRYTVSTITVASAAPNVVSEPSALLLLLLVAAMAGFRRRRTVHVSY